MTAEPAAPTAAAVAGALADEHRRLAFAAVQLGAQQLDDVAARAGLTAGQAAKALGKLAATGVIREANGHLEVAGDAFQQAARAALAKEPTAEHDDAPSAARKVLTAFVVDGRIQSIPTTHSKRMVLLDWLAQEFEPGRRYTEQMVNLTIGRRHADTAAWRRYLVDEGFLDREAGVYWRSGGTVA